MLDALFDGMASLLNWFYELWPSYAVAIVMLTVTVMLVLTPLTLKGTRSMMAMQRLQPEMKKIQQRYKDDRQKLNEELLAFYKENKINPLGGCLPLLLQMPVFIVLYQVISGLTRRGDDGLFDPKYLDDSTDLFQNLSQSREMVSWGMDLSESATAALQDSFVHALPYLVLIVFVAATSYIQQKQVSGRNPNAPMNPQQQLLLKILPAFFAFISLGLPAGVVVYFFASNLWRMGQQAFISRTMYAPAAAGGGVIETTGTQKDTAKERAKDGGDRDGGGDGRGGKSSATGTGRGGSGKAKASSGGSRSGGNGRSGPRPKGRPNGRAGRAPTPAPHPRSRKKRKRK